MSSKKEKEKKTSPIISIFTDFFAICFQTFSCSSRGGMRWSSLVIVSRFDIFRWYFTAEIVKKLFKLRRKEIKSFLAGHFHPRERGIYINSLWRRFSEMAINFYFPIFLFSLSLPAQSESTRFTSHTRLELPRQTNFLFFSSFVCKIGVGAIKNCV